jgi:methylenetetrahydrofolate dehydrogenase (NADP+)/methenyltetrahydrofolate cyclohydrolase
MVAKIINGKEIAAQMRKSITDKVVDLKNSGTTPGLAVVLVGEDSASKTYVNMKEKACEQVGMYSRLIRFEETISEEELLQTIHELNADHAIHGILVQLPLPKHISETKVLETIIPEKDVDGFHPINIGRMMTGQDTFVSCTPFGILKMLQFSNIKIEGKNAVIVGRSNIVGKPIGQLLLNENATVTYCHSRTVDLSSFTKKADILIVATGIAGLIGQEDIKPGAVVIDVGMNRDEKGKLCGDVEFEGAKEVASYITPVPGGVGPMTITMLMHNTLKSASNYASIRV